MATKIPGIWIFWLFAILGAIFIVIGIVSIINTIQLTKHAVRTTGEVVKLIPKQGDNGTTYAPEVRFIDPATGDEIFFTSSYSTNPPSHRPGEIIQILYPAQDPYRAKVDSGGSLYMGAVVLLILGLMCASFGGGFLAWQKHRKALAETLRTTGMRVEATVTSIQQNPSITINGRSPYVIYAQQQNTSSGTVQVYRSDNVWFDPSASVQQGQTVTVFVDPQNPKRYSMDISFLPELHQ